MIFISFISFTEDTDEIQTSITILDFRITDVTEPEMMDFVDHLAFQLKENVVRLRDSGFGNYRIIDRTERNRLVRERQYSMPDTPDEKDQLEIRRLIDADQIVKEA